MRLRTACGVAIVVAAGGLPMTAQATSATSYEVFVPDARLGSQPLAHFASSLSRPADRLLALRRHQIAGAAAAGVPTALLVAAQVAAAPSGAALVRVQDSSSGFVVISSGGVFSMSTLLPAGDVNGDGTRDVLDVRYGKAGNGHQAVMTAVRSGDSGRVLWHRTDVLAPGHAAFPVPTSVGAAAHPGVVMLDLGFEKRDGNTIDVSDKLTALDGRTGSRLWQHADRGTVSFSNGFSGTHAPSVQGFLQAGAGSKDALITFSDYSEDSTGQLHGSVAFYRVSGKNGAVARAGATATSNDSLPQPFAVPDVSGDGREDYVVLTGGATPKVEARRGDTGAPVWQNTSLTLQRGAYALPAGRVLGTRVQDLAVVSGAPQSAVPEIGTPAGNVSDPTTPVHGQVSLLRGDTGAQVWSQTGDGAFAVQRAGSGKVSALGVTTSDTTTDANGTTETLHLQAYDVPGTQLYDRAYTVHAPADRADGTFSFGVAAAFAYGDLQHDGAQDGEAFLFAIDGNNMRQRSLLFDGAAGTAVPGNHSLVGGTLTGAGDDLLDVTPGASIAVTARSGRDLHQLFVRRLPTRTRTQYAYGYGERILGRCASLLVAAGSKTSGYAAVLTATGVPRWSIEHAANDLTAKPATVGPGRASTACA